jgi:hypothetical protein
MDQMDELLISIVEQKKKSTLEIERDIASSGLQCPETTIRRLNILRRKGFIQGEVSVADGIWVWWKN